MTAPRAPKGLGKDGRQLWRSVLATYRLRPDEVLLLEKAARTADDVARLEAVLEGQPLTVSGSTGQPRAHPLLIELRGMRALLAQLLRQLHLPDAVSKGEPLTASEQARKAALVRWDRGATA